MLMRVPWLGKEQRRVNGSISQIDLVPTLLDLLDESIPEGLEGSSRAGILRGTQTLAENDVFIEWNGVDARPIRHFENGVPAEEWHRVRGPWRTIVSAERWKLNLSPHDHCELYDLNTDPYEQRNLFDDPGQRERIQDLRERVRRWQKETADQVPLPAL